jgi:hypothetical protein
MGFLHYEKPTGRQVSLNVIIPVRRLAQRVTYRELLMSVYSTFTCSRKELIHNLIKSLTMEETTVSELLGGVYSKYNSMF